MRKVLALLLSALLTTSLIVSLTSCKSDAKEIEVWIGGSIVGEDELDKPQDSWVIAQLLKKYEDEHAISIKLTYFEDEEAMVQLIANNERSNKEVPDFACIYSSEILRDMADTIYPITDYLTDEEKSHILFWETVSKNGKGIAGADEILGYPIGGTEVTFIAYNKKVFKNAGIDIESAPPQTYDDFYSMCDVISATGVTPIVASSDGWNELYLQVFSKRWVQYSGNEAITSMSRGEGSFSEDKNLIESLSTANDYYEKGFLNKDYATNDDAITLFSNGQGAMFSCSNYDLNLLREVMGDNLGVFA